jgi:hypothetical protein
LAVVALAGVVASAAVVDVEAAVTVEVVAAALVVAVALAAVVAVALLTTARWRPIMATAGRLLLRMTTAAELLLLLTTVVDSKAVRKEALGASTASGAFVLKGTLASPLKVLATHLSSIEGYYSMLKSLSGLIAVVAVATLLAPQIAHAQSPDPTFVPKTTVINGKRVKLHKLPDGLEYYDIKVGTGPHPH